MAAADFKVKNGLIVSENLTVQGNSVLGDQTSDTTLINGSLTVKGNDLLVKDSSNVTKVTIDDATGNITSAGTVTAPALASGNTLQVVGTSTLANTNITGIVALTGTENVTGQLNVDNLRLDGNVLSSTDTNGNVTITPNGSGKVVASSALDVGGTLTVTGNLVVNGTTTTVNSTAVTLDDPIMTLGGDTAPSVDDNKDRGVEFRWHNGTVAKVGFFGFDDSTGKFVFVPDATNTSEVFSGTKGTIDAKIEWDDILSKPASATSGSFGNLTVSDTDSGYTWASTGSALSDIAYDTATFVSGSGLNIDVDAAADAIRFTNSDKGSDQSIFKNIANASGTTQFSAASNTDAIRFAGGGTTSVVFDADTKKITFTTADQYNGTVTSVGSGTLDGVTLTVDTATTTPALNITNTDKGSAQNIFKNFAVSGQDSIVAETNNDTLTLVGSNGVTLTTNAGTDTLTVSMSQDLQTTASPSFVGVTGTTFGANSNKVLDFTSGVLLKSDGNVTIDLDNDANGTNSFILRNGADSDILTINEAGTAILYGVLDVAGSLGSTGSNGSVRTNSAGDKLTFTYAGVNTIEANNEAATLKLFASGTNGIVKLSNANGDVTLNANGSVTFTDGVSLPSMVLNTYTVTGVHNDGTMATAPSDKLITAAAAKEYTDSSILAYAIAFGL